MLNRFAGSTTSIDLNIEHGVVVVVYQVTNVAHCNGEKMKLGVREKNEKEERKKGKITLKKGEEALKLHLFGL